MDPDGSPIWTSMELRKSAAAPDFVVASVDVELLKKDSYSVTLVGVDAAGTGVPLGDYRIRIVRE